MLRPRPAAANADGVDAATAEAAQRVSKLLLGEAGPGAGAASDGGSSSSSDGSDGDGEGGGATLADWLASLPRLPPLAAAQRRQEQLRGQLDAAVEASIEAEERYKAAAGAAAGGPLQQEALAQLERAADLQKVWGVGTGLSAACLSCHVAGPCMVSEISEIALVATC